MLYFFYPDKTVVAFDDWPLLPEKPPLMGTIMFDSNDPIFPWVIYTNDRGGLIDKDPRTLPNWVRAYALLL